MIVENKLGIISQSKIVSQDERGLIEQLTDSSFNSVLRITSKKGAVRANHYHKEGSHLCYLVSGHIRYVERPAEDETAPLKEYIIEPGQLFYSAPMVAHAMEFLDDSEFYTFSQEKRTQAGYEKDLVRVTLITPVKLA